MKDPKSMTNGELLDAIEEIDEYLDEGARYPLADPDPAPYERASDQREELYVELNTR